MDKKEILTEEEKREMRYGKRKTGAVKRVEVV